MLQLLLSALIYVEYLKDVNCSPIKGADKVLDVNWLIRALDYRKTNPETLDELMTEHNAFSEGDIKLLSDRNAVEYTWPDLNGQTSIAYLISPDIAKKTINNIQSAMAMVSEHTCVSFHKRTTEPDYLIFENSEGCSSYVGWIGGEQDIGIAPICTVGNICHELLHALGFHHEHTRTDRGKYIKILTQNIMDGMEKNFETQQGNTFNLPYDVGSIMHYGSVFFSATGSPTILPKDNRMDMGQRTHMTTIDVQKVRHLYNCDAKESKSDVGKEHDGTRPTIVWNQDNVTRWITVKGLLPPTLGLGQNSSELVSGPSTTNTTSGLSQGDVSASPSSASPSPIVQKSMATTRGHNDTSTVKEAAQS